MFLVVAVGVVVGYRMLLPLLLLLLVVVNVAKICWLSLLLGVTGC